MRAFLKKEWMEQCRTGRLWMLLLIFALLGIMNPVFAKLTPWLMEMLSESLAEAGLVTKAVTVDAMTSWTQFYKNVPIGLVIFALLVCGSFPAECQKGTLIPVVTKGLSRRKILLAKSLMLFASWTALYWICFGITYGYNAYFWDNGIADHLFFAAALPWLFGVFVIALLLLFSAAVQTGTQVLLGTGAVVMGAYLLNIFPNIRTFLPIKLMDGLSLLQNASFPKDYAASIAAAGLAIFLCMALAFVCFDRKQL